MSVDDVLVTGHARQRALERALIGVQLVAYEVAQAIEAGRMAVNEPAWTVGERERDRADRTHAGAKRGKLRWVWPPEQTRAYLISRRGGRWIVVTVINAAPLPEAQAA
jgi:hypothetical protein